MRKLIVFCHLSLDGIAAVPSGSLDWVAYDSELEKYVEPIVAATATALYGHVTYELMKYFRTVPSNPNASKHDIEHAAWIEQVKKVVVANPDTLIDWNNTKLISTNIKEEIMKLKEGLGGNITVFGSPTLANELIRAGLVDEYWLTVSPVVLGEGKHLFKEVKDITKLRLLEERTFDSGAIALHYSTASK